MLKNVFLTLPLRLLSRNTNKAFLQCFGTYYVFRNFSSVSTCSVKPVKMAFSSYETAPSLESHSPIIIMHGLLGSRNNWNSLSKVIHHRTKHKVIAVDARNHGDSPHTSEMSYQHLAEDVHLFMRDMNINKASLIGHSMGGRAMMFFALKYPEFVEKLLIIDISPVCVSPSLKVMPDYFSAMKQVDLRINLPLSAARKHVDKQLAVAVENPSLRQFLLTNLIEGNGGQYQWKVNLESLANNFIEVAHFPPVNSVFNGPTIFIGGGDSDFLRPDDHTLIRNIFPHAVFKYIDGAGHWVHSEKPGEFLDIVCDYILN